MTALHRLSGKAVTQIAKPTKKATMIILLLAGTLTLALGTQGAEHLDVQAERDPTRDELAFCIIQTSDGGYALAGMTASFGAGAEDFWLVKTDSSGNMEWNKTYGGVGEECAYCVIQTSDGGYASVGETIAPLSVAADFLLVKTDSSGNMQWNKTYGGVDGDFAYSVVETIDEGYALVGYLATLGAGKDDFELIKTDADGNMEWNKTYGGANIDRAVSLVYTNDGGYALAGDTFSFGVMDGGNFWLVKTDSSGNMQWNKTYAGVDYNVANSIIQTVDEGYALAGRIESAEVNGNIIPSNHQARLVKVDSSGNLEWNKTYGGNDWEDASCVIESSHGGYVLAGATMSYGAGNWDYWLIKTDSSGNMQWNKTYGGDNVDGASCVVETSDGGYALVGHTMSFGADNYDFWLVKVDSSGNMEWNKMYGGTPEIRPWILIVSAATAVMIITVAAIVKYRSRKRTSAS